MKMYDFSYKHDDLFLFLPSERTYRSIPVQQDIIMDLTADKHLNALEFINASKTFQQLMHMDLEETKEVLENLTSCSLDFQDKGGKYIVNLQFVAKGKSFSQSISIPIAAI